MALYILYSKLLRNPRVFRRHYGIYLRVQAKTIRRMYLELQYGPEREGPLMG